MEANGKKKGEAWEPTDVLVHRYADPVVLKESLIRLGIRGEYVMKATKTRGFEIKLDRKLTKSERSQIFDDFEKHRYAAE